MEPNKNRTDKKLPEGNPFSVPEGYFDNLSERIENKINEEKTIDNAPETRRAFLNFMALAAGFLLFVVISYSFLHFILGDKTVNTIPAGSDYIAFVESEIYSFNTDMIIDEILDNYQPGESPDLNPASKEEAMIEFLIEENIDLNTLMNEF